MSNIATSLAAWLQERASQFSGQILFSEPLSKHTYYRIGGPATVVAIPKSSEDLLLLSQALRETGTELFILGLGSNVLVSDFGFEGLVVKASRIDLETAASPPDSAGLIRLKTGASAAISSLLRRAVQEGWGGLEFLTGIPGSIGGVVVMNGGTHLGEAKDRIKSVEAFSFRDGKSMHFEGESLRFQYRKNLFLPEGAIVTRAEWEVRRDDPAKVKSLLDETLARRKSTQPIEYPSCGSVFKNPRESGMSAWQVIDRLGLRGHRIGGAQFAEKHSNFIINHLSQNGGAKAADVKALIDLAKSRAQSELQVALEEEVKYLGKF